MKKILFFLSIAIVIGCIVYQGIYKFSHPDMTSTRMFLNTWKVNVIALIGLAYAFWYVKIELKW